MINKGLLLKWKKQSISVLYSGILWFCCMFSRKFIYAKKIYEKICKELRVFIWGEAVRSGVGGTLAFMACNLTFVLF